jgi:hypothetical protein
LTNHNIISVNVPVETELGLPGEFLSGELRIAHKRVDNVTSMHIKDNQTIDGTSEVRLNVGSDQSNKLVDIFRLFGQLVLHSVLIISHT